MDSVGIIYDPIYLQHDTGIHCENADRLNNSLKVIEETGIKDKLFWIPPRHATEDELAMIHAREYISRVQQVSLQGGGHLDYDTVLSSASYEAATMAAGGSIVAVESVLNRKVRSAFALVRPPGHHATCWQGQGFCLFNNIAIAAKYVLTNYDNIKRIMIVDFDVHHGNGTQEAFYTIPEIFYFSTHQFPHYPGTGNIDEIGLRSGEGFNMNIPMVSGWGDYEYKIVYEDIFAPIALRFEPQIILVSAGYDAHWADTLSGMRVSVSGFARIVEVLKFLANKLCDGRLVFCLEGGYDLTAMPYSVASTLNVLLEGHGIDDPLGEKESYAKYNDFNKFVLMIRERYGI